MKAARVAAASVPLTRARRERVGNWLALLALIASSIVLSPADAARASPVTCHPGDATASGGLSR
jgi:hypothetical protein